MFGLFVGVFGALFNGLGPTEEANVVALAEERLVGLGDVSEVTEDQGTEQSYQPDADRDRAFLGVSLFPAIDEGVTSW